MSIDFGKIVTNAVSALVTAVFVGAGVIVWNAAMTIDSRIDKANDGLETANQMLAEQQAGLLATQDTIVEQITENSAELQILAASVNEALALLPNSGADLADRGRKEDASFDVYDEAEVDGWKLDERQRLKQGIETRQFQNLQDEGPARGN